MACGHSSLHLHTDWAETVQVLGSRIRGQISVEVSDTILDEQLGRLAAILQADKPMYLLYRSKQMPNVCQEWPQQHQTLKI